MDKAVTLVIILAIEFVFMFAGVELAKAGWWWEPFKVALTIVAINGILLLFGAVAAYLNGDVKTETKD